MVSETDESYDPHARMHDSFPRADSGSENAGGGAGVQMAGEVIPIAGEKSMGPGQTLKATGYYYGTKSDPKVISILPRVK